MARSGKHWTFLGIASQVLEQTPGDAEIRFLTAATLGALGLGTLATGQLNQLGDEAQGEQSVAELFAALRRLPDDRVSSATLEKHCKDNLAALTTEARADTAPAPARTSASDAIMAQPVATTAPASSTETAAATARAMPVAAQIGHEIVRRFNNESTQFQMRLDPPELGRVDIKLEVSRDHRVSAVISADTPQAVTELARHARELEQTLQSAGLELKDNGLSFDLNQSRQGFAEARDNTSGARKGAASSETSEPAAIAARPLGMESWRGVRVDVMA